MSEQKFVYVTYINTTPEKVWEALTNGDFTYQYWAGRRIESDWKPGSRVRHLMEDGGIDWDGEVLECDPPRRLAYTFDVRLNAGKKNVDSECGCHGSGEPPSRVTFEIESFRDKVKLIVTHDQFPPDSKVLPGISKGWPAILCGLKSLLETGEALFPDWR